jgi:hypothetical protein
MHVGFSFLFSLAAGLLACSPDKVESEPEGADASDSAVRDADDTDGAIAPGPDAASDTGADAIADGGDASPCPAAEGLFYDAPGCGSSAVLVCLDLVQDACAGIFCGCDGVTYSGGCGTSTKPFAHLGACTDAGDAADGGDAG